MYLFFNFVIQDDDDDGDDDNDIFYFNVNHSYIISLFLYKCRISSYKYFQGSLYYDAVNLCLNYFKK